MDHTRLLNGKQTIAVVDNQFGDSGKGKIVDVFAEWADIIARGTGGRNAGHTVSVDGNETITHLLPVGVIHDHAGKISVLGNGMAIDPEALLNEIEEVHKVGLTTNNLHISEDANVVMPYHIARDKARNQSLTNGGIGSTGNGIEPCYTDHRARRGIMIGDLFNEDTLAKRIREAKETYNEQELNIDELVAQSHEYGKRLDPWIRETISLMHNWQREGKRILLEGAQGLGLSIDFGTYPYVTSSDCSVNGTASGVGISARSIDEVFGVVKFPYMTRVGGGPFPTELGQSDSEEHCSAGTDHDIFYDATTYLGMNLPDDEIAEAKRNNDLVALNAFEKKVKTYIAQNRNKVLELINSIDPFEQGIGVRLAGFEYGATTKRPRRTGWTDAVMQRYAEKINGPMKIILTKPDALSGAKGFKVCYEYRTSSRTGTNEFTRDSDFLNGIQPKFETYEGYGDISDVQLFHRLPESLVRAAEEFERFTGSTIAAVSTGADREQIIVR